MVWRIPGKNEVKIEPIRIGYTTVHRVFLITRFLITRMMSCGRKGKPYE
jgi:hypothetical protein